MSDEKKQKLKAHQKKQKNIKNQKSLNIINHFLFVFVTPIFLL